jgi:hypothetical protein
VSSVEAVWSAAVVSAVTSGVEAVVSSEGVVASVEAPLSAEVSVEGLSSVGITWGIYGALVSWVKVKTIKRVSVISFKILMLIPSKKKTIIIWKKGIHLLVLNKTQ